MISSDTLSDISSEIFLIFFLTYLFDIISHIFLTTLSDISWHFFRQYFWHISLFFFGISSEILFHITFNMHSDSVMINGMMMGPWIHRWISNIRSSQPQQSVAKVPTCVGHFHLTKGDEMSIHFRNCWMDFDICCFELASLDVLISADSRFKPVVGGERYGIRAPQRECWSQKVPFFGVRKSHFCGVRKNVNQTSSTTQKAQCKNITRKKKHNEKMYLGKFPKKVQALA